MQRSILHYVFMYTTRGHANISKRSERLICVNCAERGGRCLRTTAHSRIVIHNQQSFPSLTTVPKYFRSKCHIHHIQFPNTFKDTNALWRLTGREGGA